jgi:hypothetical protein
VVEVAAVAAGVLALGQICRANRWTSRSPFSVNIYFFLLRGFDFRFDFALLVDFPPFGFFVGAFLLFFQPFFLRRNEVRDGGPGAGAGIGSCPGASSNSSSSPPSIQPLDMCSSF